MEVDKLVVVVVSVWEEEEEEDKVFPQDLSI